MDFLLPLIIGLVVGWIAKWLFDSMTSSKVPTSAEAQEQYSRKLEAAEYRIQELKTELRETKQPAVEVVFKEKDRLELIRGIGPVFAKRLNEAGVHTFSDLANTSPGRVRQIISPQDWQAIDPPNWIDQARDLVMSAEVNGGYTP